MIDPQGQANRWIRNMEKETGLDVVKPLDKDLLRSLENGVHCQTTAAVLNCYRKQHVWWRRAQLLQASTLLFPEASAEGRGRKLLILLALI